MKIERLLSSAIYSSGILIIENMKKKGIELGDFNPPPTFETSFNPD